MKETNSRARHRLNMAEMRQEQNNRGQYSQRSMENDIQNPDLSVL
jgi:hypothetical protein